MNKVRKFEMSNYESIYDLEVDLAYFINQLRFSSAPNMFVEYTYRYGSLQHVFVIYDEK